MEATRPALADNEHTLCLSEVLAMQLSQLPPDTEPCGTRLDCQGLKLLSRDRVLHWESLVRCLKSPGSPASSAAGSHFLEQAALADCKAQAVPGTMRNLCCGLATHTYIATYTYIAHGFRVCLAQRECMDCYPWLLLQVGYQVSPTLAPHLQPLDLLLNPAALLIKVGQPVFASASTK